MGRVSYFAYNITKIIDQFGIERIIESPHFSVKQSQIKTYKNKTIKGTHILYRWVTRKSDPEGYYQTFLREGKWNEDLNSG